MILPAERLSVRRQCELLEISRSSYYYVPRPESEATIKLMNRIDEIFTNNPDYGSRFMRKVLKREDGILVNHKRIVRLMRKMGICTIYPGDHGTQPSLVHEEDPVVGNLPVAGQRLLHLGAQASPRPMGQTRNLQLRPRLAVQQLRLPVRPSGSSDRHQHGRPGPSH